MSAALKMLPRESQTRVGMMSFLIVMASIGYGLLHAFLPASPQPGPVSTAQQPQNADATPASPRDECLSIAANPPKYLDLSEDVFRRANPAWGGTCRQALAA